MFVVGAASKINVGHLGLVPWASKTFKAVHIYCCKNKGVA